MRDLEEDSPLGILTMKSGIGEGIGSRFMTSAKRCVTRRCRRRQLTQCHDYSEERLWGSSELPSGQPHLCGHELCVPEYWRLVCRFLMR